MAPNPPSAYPLGLRLSQQLGPTEWGKGYPAKMAGYLLARPAHSAGAVVSAKLDEGGEDGTFLWQGDPLCMCVQVCVCVCVCVFRCN